MSKYNKSRIRRIFYEEKSYHSVSFNDISVNECTLIGCGSNTAFDNPGDTLGGGGVVDDIPTETNSVSSSSIDTQIGTISTDLITEDVAGATDITPTGTISKDIEIKSDGSYKISGNIDLGAYQLKVAKSLTNVVLYFNGVTLNKSTDKKAVNAKSNITIVLVSGTSNSVTTTHTDCDAIGGDSNVTIQGSGSLTINATDDCISCDGTLKILGGTIVANSTGGSALNAESIVLKNANITGTTVNSDVVHAEINYDAVTSATDVVFTYEKGFVYVESSTLKLTSKGTGDGIQGDTFVDIVSGTINIKTNGGATTNITESSSDAVDGKGIKAGCIDYTVGDSADELELSSEKYCVLIKGGTLDINSNDDAIHSNGESIISGGTFTISTGDDGIHAEILNEISGGTITINKSYEGIEGAKVEIQGGTIDLYSVDDGINAADGTNNQGSTNNTNCHIIINGGSIIVNADGDGIDSNGTLLFSGGYTYVNEPTNGGNASLDSNGGILCNGGYLVAVGALGMVETPSVSSSQYVISYAQSSTISSNTYIDLQDSSNNSLVNMTTKKTCQSIIISCPEIKNGSTYGIYLGDTKTTDVTISSILTSIGTTNTGNQGGGPGDGGHGGGRP